MLERLRKLLAKGFPVTVHAERLGAVRLPLTVTEQVPFAGGQLEVTATPAVLESGQQVCVVWDRFRVSRVSRAELSR